MNRIDRKIDYWGFRLNHIIVLICTVAVMIFILISATNAFVTGMQSAPVPAIRKVETRYVILSPGSLSRDSLVYKSITDRIDAVEKANSESLSDLRQESNNIINKVNGWLGFWIAILAIFCGIVPMVVQYILRQKSKREIEEMVDQLADRLENSRLQLLVSCINTVYTYRIIVDSRLKTEFLKIFTHKAYIALTEIINHLRSGEGPFDSKDEVNLLGALIQYSRILDILLDICQRQGRTTRDLWGIRTRLNDIVESILDHEKNSREVVWNRLMDLLPSLQHLPIP